MLLRKVGLGLVCSSALLAGGVSRAETMVQTGTQSVQIRTYELLDKDMGKIGFTPGSSTLSANSHQDIDNFIAQVKQAGPNIDQFIVTAWSDKDFHGGKELPKADRNLASARAKAVAEVLKKDSSVKTINTFEMTSAPNWFQRVFSTEGAELKGQGRTSSQTEMVYREIGDKLRSKGGPGSVVIVAKFKHEVAAH